MHLRTSPLLFSGLAAIALAAAPQAQVRAPSQPLRQEQQAPAVDPKADAVLRSMSRDLASMRSFRVTAESSTEVVLQDGQKLQFLASSVVSARRPDRLRSDREGGARGADMSLLYDGSNIVLVGEKTKTYATVPAPRSLDEMIDFARARLGIEAPGADLLYSDPYRILTEGVTSGTYVGEAVVDGVLCDQIALRSAETDVQLWVEKGERALPRRYLITSKTVTGAPEFVVELRNWEVNADLPDSLFTFRPPPGFDRVEFAQQAGAGARTGGSSR